MNNANSYDVQVFRVWYIIVFVPEFPPEIPMGIYGIPLCPMETRSVRHGKPWRVARQPAVPHRMHCIPHGIPRVPGVYDNKINMRVNPRLISTEIYELRWDFLVERVVCAIPLDAPREFPWDPEANFAAIPA